MYSAVFRVLAVCKTKTGFMVFSVYFVVILLMQEVYLQSLNLQSFKSGLIALKLVWFGNKISASLNSMAKLPLLLGLDLTCDALTNVSPKNSFLLLIAFFCSFFLKCCEENNLKTMHL